VGIFPASEMGPSDDVVDYDNDDLAAEEIWAGTAGGCALDWGPVCQPDGDGLRCDQVTNLGLTPDAFFLSPLDENIVGLAATGTLDIIPENLPPLESIAQDFGFLRDSPVTEQEPEAVIADRSDLLRALPAAGAGFSPIGLGQEENQEGLEPHSRLDHGVPEPCKEPRKHKKRCIKSKGKLSNLVLGEEVEIQHVIQMSKQTLVGRVNGRVFAIGTVYNWMKEEWGFLGYVPEVIELNRKWFAFTFQTKEQAQSILRRVWSIQNSPMLLKPWSPMFDASRERVDIIPIWVRLPGLPPYYWEEKFFKSIGNKIGEFVEADNSYLDTRQRKMARILVNINVREGLGEEVDLVFGPFHHTQKLDYENIPFRCRRCHEYGHLVEDCKLPLRIIKRKVPKEVARASQGNETQSASPSQVRAVEETVPRGHSQDIRLISQVAGAEAIKKGRSSRKESCMKWVHPTLPLAFSTGIPTAPCTSLSSLLQNLNLNLESNRWLESLNASLNVPNAPILKPLELEASPSSMAPRSGLVLSERPLSLDRKRDTLRNSGSNGYYLRSKLVPNPDGGLGLEKVKEGGGRGRKSFLSKAKSKARSDMLAGKQQSIEGALRAARAQDMGSQ